MSVAVSEVWMDFAVMRPWTTNLTPPVDALGRFASCSSGYPCTLSTSRCYDGRQTPSQRYVIR